MSTVLRWRIEQYEHKQALARPQYAYFQAMPLLSHALYWRA